MTTTETRSDNSTPLPAAGEMKLEVIVLPVSDVDRARQFYQNLGWRLDADLNISPEFRVVQFTPPGSQASIRFGIGVNDATPGSSVCLDLAVQDVGVARADLLARGVQVSEVFHGRGGFSHRTGPSDRVPGPDPQQRSYQSFIAFEDPDSNSWILQEIRERLPGR
jgi:catechol 2,3-dioxygenase-like lactoylglutathione lyase family enzyme